ncbi:MULTISPECIES: spore germination lipoprotein GerD [unclassified Sporolactobacillus]|uniref:spore germination lipoprotein GerD n=1 Tax=unclassified Sporolactobacillus TaxID=2628533 RepID=UPI002368CDBA|nr:spore germination lipoprotein GerD [Sporolactobacillus sp. CQH2019]MDD9150566.1 spore germination lipoprotein GerD [Sporolactobacillus sp. CQH2019]
MAKIGPIILALLMLLVAGAGCSSESEQPTYQENKKMVLDMLKTDEGKQAVKELLQDREIRNTLAFDEPAVKKAVTETLTTEQGKKIWNGIITDPQFSGRLARAMQQENEALLKKMMKDPDYQGMMMDILKAPGLQEQYLDLMKTQPFREQIKMGVQDALTGPSFQKQLMDAISEALKKQSGKSS